jgi:hypothetical protein
MSHATTELSDFDIDPNAPTDNQVKLKRVEVAIRRRADVHLALFFDGIAFMEPAARREAMIELRRKLES